MPRPVRTRLKPYWQTADGSTVRLYQGDVMEVLRRLPAASVHCVVTSPPYWGLRDYGTGTWEGGDEECDHVKPNPSSTYKVNIPDSKKNQCEREKKAIQLFGGQYQNRCKKCGARRIDRQLGSEKLHDCLGWAMGINCAEVDWENGCHVCRMVLVFREVRRVLRDDGTVWLNYGDSYGGGGGQVDFTATSSSFTGGRNPRDKVDGHRGREYKTKLPSGNLCGVPWRVALALQADGWILRQDIIWCLSGGTWVYARTQKGDMPMTLKDLYRLRPGTAKLWNGREWVDLLGMSKTNRTGEEIQIQLRSGERINCTQGHKFPTQRGLLTADSLRIGDVLETCVIPQPDEPKQPAHVGLDAAWLAGLYIAEGSGLHNTSIEKFGLAGHAKEVERWERVRQIAEDYGGYATLTVNGNNQTIRVFGKLICAVLRELVSGKTSYDKYFSPVVWRYGNDFIEAMADGYLSGDGAEDTKSHRWRLGFTDNHWLARDLRVVCARLGWRLTLNHGYSTFDGVQRSGYRGEIRKSWNPGYRTEKDRGEVVAIRKARSRLMFDVGVSGESHLFALASGVLTHNSKPSPMPESVRNRCTKAHEYVFLLAKRMGYYYDAEAVKERQATREDGSLSAGTNSNRQSWKSETRESTEAKASKWRSGNERDIGSRNKRSVWNVASFGYPGAHFATFPPKLIEPMILAGTSEKGCCAKCGAPWKRVTATKKLKRKRPHDYVKRTGEKGTGNSCANSVAGVDVKTLRWVPSCDCDAGAVPCTVMDPFVGSGTTCCVALGHGRRSIGIDLSEAYMRDNAVPRIEGELQSRPSMVHLAGYEVEVVDFGDELTPP